MITNQVGHLEPWKGDQVCGKLSDFRFDKSLWKPEPDIRKACHTTCASSLKYAAKHTQDKPEERELFQEITNCWNDQSEKLVGFLKEYVVPQTNSQTYWTTSRNVTKKEHKSGTEKADSRCSETQS